MPAFQYAVWSFQTFCLLFFYSAVVAAITYQVRMHVRRVTTVSGKSVLIIFGGAAFVAAAMALFAMLWDWNYASIAVCVAAALVLAFKTPISAQ
jgi:hypothetical protein